MRTKISFHRNENKYIKSSFGKSSFGGLRTTVDRAVLHWFRAKNLDRSWTIGQTGRILFSAEDYTNMSYYNCCGIRPKHSDISKRVREGVFTICGQPLHINEI
jgi:hypothetical protein